VDLVLLPLQIALVLAGAPLLQGVIKTIKARWQSRRGPTVLSPTATSSNSSPARAS
jgi:formate hydrogenlyase subunit 4